MTEVALRMGTDNVEFDPFDSVDVRIESIAKLPSELRIEELVNESSVKLLLGQNMVNLTELKAARTELEELKRQNDSLRDTRESLRILLAESGKDAAIDLASILISLLGGFAIALVSRDSSSALGWVILVLSVGIILRFKWPGLRKRVGRVKKTEGER